MASALTRRQTTRLHLTRSGGTPSYPVENYLGSFGDNYCIGCNNPGMTFPTETPYTLWPPVPGQPRIGWPGEQGTLLDINCNGGPTAGAAGVLRGMFDVTTGQTVKLASVTDGTSNTIAAGEGLPAQRADNNVWAFNSGANGTTVPMNYSMPRSPGQAGVLPTGPLAAPTQTRASRAITPADATFVFVDGSVHFLKQSINMYTYCALGSRDGGEVISSDSY